MKAGALSQTSRAKKRCAAPQMAVGMGKSADGLQEILFAFGRRITKSRRGISIFERMMFIFQRKTSAVRKSATEFCGPMCEIREKPSRDLSHTSDSREVQDVTSAILCVISATADILERRIIKISLRLISFRRILDSNCRKSNATARESIVVRGNNFAGPNSV